jgi:hypothetical protein
MLKRPGYPFTESHQAISPKVSNKITSITCGIQLFIHLPICSCLS